MKRFLFSIFLFFSLLVIAWGFVIFGTGKGYQEYQNEWEYRRLHPELIPSTMTVKIFAMGHTSSYASFVWLELIQYIGDNVGGNRFLNFSHNILKHITTLHPYFIKPYEIDLILAPTSLGENLNEEKRKKNKIYTEHAIELGKNGIEQLCDAEKIQKIRQHDIGTNLWNNTTLKNPCPSGTLPYYIAFATYQMGDNRAGASEYYKIASMNDDAPNASRLLGVLALSAEGDYRASALNFALIGSTGYDIAPYTCRNFTIELANDLTTKRSINQLWIQELANIKMSLKENKDPKNIISGASDNCYDMSVRAIETIYLNYISDISQGTPAKNETDLIKLNLLKNTQTNSIKNGFSVYKKNEIWQYRPIIK